MTVLGGAPLRVVLGNDYSLVSPPFTNADETPTDATGTPVATVVDIYGDTLSAPTVASGSSTGVYTAALTDTVHTAELNVLTVTWTATVTSQTRRVTQRVEVVGDHYVTIPELMERAGSGWSVDQVRRARDRFVSIAEEYRGVAYVPRISKVTVPTAQLRGRLVDLDLRQVRSIERVRVDGTATTAYESHRPGVVELDSTPVDDDVDVEVIATHGYDNPPEPIRHACLLYVQAVLQRDESGLSRDALWSVQDGITFRMGTSDWGNKRPTGYQGVDELLNSVRDERPILVL